MDLGLLVVFLLAGFALGFFQENNRLLSRLARWVVHFGLLLLISAMGARIGADPEVIADLGRIGLQSFGLALGGITGSVICLYIFSYYVEILREQPDRYEPGVYEASGDEGGLRLTAIILLVVTAGCLAGWLILPETALPLLTSLTSYSLMVLFVGVGVDIGQKRGIFRQIRELGWRIIAIPLLVAIGSIIGTVIAGTLLGLLRNESAALGAGFGWYSLSAVLLTDLHSVELGSMAFLTNIMREMLALIIIPLIAPLLGSITAIAPGGATTMDVTLPLLKKVGGEEVVLPAFINGVVLTALVPLLVPFLLTL